MGLSTYEPSIDLSRPSRCFPLYRRVNRLSHPLRGRGRWNKERGQPRHSGFVPLIILDNSLPLSRYADLSLSSADIYLSLSVTAALNLNSGKFSVFIVLDLVFTTLAPACSYLKCENFRKIFRRKLSQFCFEQPLFVNECYIRQYY